MSERLTNSNVLCCNSAGRLPKLSLAAFMVLVLAMCYAQARGVPSSGSDNEDVYWNDRGTSEREERYIYC